MKRHLLGHLTSLRDSRHKLYLSHTGRHSYSRDTAWLGADAAAVCTLADPHSLLQYVLWDLCTFTATCTDILGIRSVWVQQDACETR